MTLLASGPWTIVDDDGSGGTGTPLNAAFFAALKDSIEDVTHSPTNTTQDPFETTDEVIAARDGEASLLAKINAIDTAVAAISVTKPDLGNLLGQTNIVLNDLFDFWHLGDALAPTGYTFGGAGGSVARTGTGLADTTRKVGDFAVRLRRAAATTALSQIAISTAATAKILAAIGGQIWGLGAWVRSTAIGGARIYIDDGSGATYSSANAVANTWEWLTVNRTVDAASTYIAFGISNDTNGADAYLSAPVLSLCASGVAPQRWVPAPTTYISHAFEIQGVVATGATQRVWPVHRPGIVKDVQLAAGVVPVGAALIVDVNTWDGAAFTSMFSTRPTIADGARTGGTQPDTTYARRCIGFQGGGTVTTGGLVSIDVDQVGSGTPGSNLVIALRCLHPARFFESAAGYADIGV